MDERITKFLRRHHVLTLATVSADGEPWCAHAFYAFDAELGRVVFMSDDATTHAAQMAARPEVALAVALETRVVGRLQGCQMRGRAERGDTRARRTYLKRFPFAAASASPVWSVDIEMVKFTDNTLGFGKKLIWQRDTDTRQE